MMHVCLYMACPVRITCHLLQGSAVIIPAYLPGTDLASMKLSPSENKGRAIRYLVSAPTMRVPMNVTDTPNAYLALRATLIAGVCVCVSTHVISVFDAWIW